MARRKRTVTDARSSQNETQAKYQKEREKMSSFAKNAKKAGISKPEPRKRPIWRGPLADGVTQSLIGKFLGCRERFRLLVVEGLKHVELFNPRIEYGNMWHICEEGYAREESLPWEKGLADYCKNLCKQYQSQQNEISKWYEICKRHFPIYIEYWEQHKHVKQGERLLQEREFSVPYTLPSRRVVLLRGKWDSVDYVRPEGLWLQENKTKSEVDVVGLTRQLAFDFQTMFYVVALEIARDQKLYSLPSHPIAGVRYNVIKRPLSGGKGTIVQHQPSKKNPKGETLQEYLERLRGILYENRAEYFARFEVKIGATCIERFKQRCLNPILEQLCDWWQWVTTDLADKDVFAVGGGRGLHWQHPYGLYNILNEGGSSDYDGYLETGSEAGLKHTDNLFPELGTN